MTQQVWYKQFWPWFLILLPLAAVTASFYTLTLAINTRDSLVVDDYYNKGKAINEDISRLKLADHLHIRGELLIIGDKARLMLNKGDLPAFPALKVYFYHPTLQDHDFSQMINADYNGVYRFDLPSAISGKWQVSIEPFDARWRIQESITLPSGTAFTISGHR